MKRPPSSYDNILLSKTIKPKEKTELLAQRFRSEKSLTADFFNFYQTASDSERGTCLGALTLISKEHPQFLESALDFIIEQINAKAPRVKWEASETIANVASTFPDRVALAIPCLLKNTKDEGTVVRWSAALALTTIANCNPSTHAKLLPLFNKLIASEENNGVRKVYEKMRD